MFDFSENANIQSSAKGKQTKKKEGDVQFPDLGLCTLCLASLGGGRTQAGLTAGEGV